MLEEVPLSEKHDGCVYLVQPRQKRANVAGEGHSNRLMIGRRFRSKCNIIFLRTEIMYFRAGCSVPAMASCATSSNTDGALLARSERTPLSPIQSDLQVSKMLTFC